MICLSIRDRPLRGAFQAPTAQIESILRQVSRNNRSNSGAILNMFAGEPGVKRPRCDASAEQDIPRTGTVRGVNLRSSAIQC
jgi:hypothetical protein